MRYERHHQLSGTAARLFGLEIDVSCAGSRVGEGRVQGQPIQGYEPESIRAAVRLSAQYINDRFLPDKARAYISKSEEKPRLLGRAHLLGRRAIV